MTAQSGGAVGHVPGYTVSARLLSREDFKAACADRDFAQVFRLMRKYDGASQGRIASPVPGLTQSRVSRIVAGRDRISSLDVVARIADNLRIPGGYVGLAARDWETDGVAAVIPTGTAAEASAGEPVGASGGGDVVDEDLRVGIDVSARGAVELRYQHRLHNLTEVPFSRLIRQFWFEHTTGPLVVRPLDGNDRKVLIQRIHDVGKYMKFACQVFPAIQSGETASIGYTCTGGLFSDKLYWRIAIHRPTRQLALRIRLDAVPDLTGCSAVEERPDGSEATVAEGLTWSRDDQGVLIELTRLALRPNQAITLRWETPNAPT